MKKIWMLCVSLALLLACTACAAGAGPLFNNAAVTPALIPTAAATTQATPSPAAVATVQPTAQAGYQITTENYDYQDAGYDMQATYPQLTGGAIPGLEAINTLIEDTALETINGSYGYEDDGSFTTVETTGTVTYKDEDFISITFNEYYNNSFAAHPSSVFRTLNIDLTDGSAVTMADMITVNAALYQALLGAAADQLSSEVSAEITPEVIEEGLDGSVLYFTPDRVGFSLWVYHALGDHIEITLPYDAAKPFMTSNVLWEKFS